MSTTPIFVTVPLISGCNISTANTNRDGAGTLGTACTGSAGGTRISRINITALGTTTAGMIRLFIDDGSAIRLWREIPVTAITPSASVAAWTGNLFLSGESALVLPENYVLKASTHNAETFSVVVEGAKP